MSDRSIVLDNGSGTIYAGFAEDDYPNPVCILPTFSGTGGIGNPGHRVNFVNLSESTTYSSFIGDTKHGDFKINYPMENGVIQNWENMESIWEYTFSEGLGINTNDFNLLITEPVMNPKSNREKMAEILFEKFKFPAVYVSQSALLPLYSAGLTTGVVLDCGDGVIQTVPVWGGYPLMEAIKRADTGGRDITTYLGRLLGEKGFGTRPFEVIKLIKEKAAFISEVAVDFSKSSTKYEESAFKLPDGEEIKLGDERYKCSELLFNPSCLEESDKLGVHEMLYQSIMKTNMDIRKDLYGNIVLSGGSSLFPGFTDRLTTEITALVPDKAKLKIIAKPDRKYATWRGGAVLASLSNFSRLLVSQQEYNDMGPSIMHKNK